VEGTTPEGLPIIQGHTINDLQRLQDELKVVDGQPSKFELPQELHEERRRIEKAAFFDWTNEHFRVFVHCVDQYGCMPEPEHKERFLKEFVKSTGKDLHDASRYYDTFLKRHTEIDANMGLRVSAGNMHATKGNRVKEMLRIKFEQIGGRVAIIPQLFTNNHVYQRGGKNFVEDIHNALLFLLHKHGLENWAEITAEFRRLRIFQFSHVAQSMPQEEVETWCHFVIRFVEKELLKHTAKKQSLEADVQAAQAALTAASAAGADEAELAEARSRLGQATCDLAAHLTPQDSCADLVYVSHMDAAQQAELYSEWGELLKTQDREQRLQERTTLKMEVEGEAEAEADAEAEAPQVVRAETPEPKREQAKDPEQAPAAASTAGATVRGRKPGRLVLQLPERPEMTLEAAMRQSRRGTGGAGAAGREGGDAEGSPTGAGAGAAAEAGAEAGAAASEPGSKPAAAPRKRAPADPNKPKAQRAPKRKADEVGGATSAASSSSPRSVAASPKTQAAGHAAYPEALPRAL